MATLSIFLVFLVVFHSQAAIPSFLGVGGKGGSSSVSLQGASFTFNPTDPVNGGVSTIGGRTLHLELEKLVLAVSHGQLIYSSQGINFTRGHGNWLTELFDERLEIKRNGRSVLQLTSSERLDLYSFRYNGTGYFTDVVMDKAVLTPIMTNLCVADRRSAGLTKRETDMCAHDSTKLHLSASQLLEQVAKVLLAMSDSAAAQSDAVQRRLKESYSEVVQSIKSDLDNQLASLKESHEAYDAWQEQQKLAAQAATNVQTIIDQTTAKLTSNLQFVEERQDEIFVALSRLEHESEANNTAMAAELMGLVNSSVSLLYDIVLNDTVAILSSKEEFMSMKLQALESNVSTNAAGLQELQESLALHHDHLNASLATVQLDVESINVSLSTALQEFIVEIGDNAKSSHGALKEELRVYVEGNHANLSAQIIAAKQDTQQLQTAHIDSQALVSAELRTLNESLAHEMDELKNFTLDSAELLWQALQQNVTNMSSTIQSVNLSLAYDVDMLINTTSAIQTMVSLMNYENKAQIEVALNNVSVSLAHSNGIFVKVIKELNVSLHNHRDQQVYLQDVVLPEMLKEQAAAAAASLQFGLDNVSTIFVISLADLHHRTAANISSLSSDFSNALAMQVGRLNDTVAVTVDHDNELVAIKQMVQENEMLQRNLAAVSSNQLARNFSDVNSRIGDLNGSFLTAMSILNESMAERVELIHSQFSEQLTLQQLHADNITFEIMEKIQASDEMEVIRLAGLSVKLQQLNESYARDLEALQSDVVDRIVAENKARSVAVLDLQDAVVDVNRTLHANLAAQEAEYLDKQSVISKMINDAAEAYIVDQGVLNQTISQNLEKLRDDGERRLMANISEISAALLEGLALIASNHSRLESNMSMAMGRVSENIHDTHQTLLSIWETSAQDLNSSQTEQFRATIAAINDLTFATQRNFTDIAAQVVYESDQILLLIADHMHQQNQSHQLITEDISVLNQSLQRYQSDVTHAIAVVNTSTFEAFLNVEERLDTMTSNVSNLATNTDITVANLVRKIDSVSSHFQIQLQDANASLVNSLAEHSTKMERLDRLVISNELAASNATANLRSALLSELIELKRQIVANTSLLQHSLVEDMQRSMGLLTAKHDASHQILLSQLDSQSIASITMGNSLSSQLNRSVLTLEQEIETLRTDSYAEQVILQKELDVVSSALQTLRQNTSHALDLEHAHRETMLKKVSHDLAANVELTDERLHRSEALTNISLLQQQATIAAHHEKLFQLQQLGVELKAIDETLQRAVHAADKQIAILETAQSQHKTDLVSYGASISKLTNEQLPVISSDVVLLQFGMQTLQKIVDSHTDDILSGRESRWQVLSNLTSLTERVQFEVAERKTKLAELHSSTNDKVDKQYNAISARVNDLQDQSNTDHQDLAQVVRTVANGTDKTTTLANDVAILKKKADDHYQLQSDVGSLKQQVLSAQEQFIAFKLEHQNEMSNLRSERDMALDTMKQMQKQLEQQSVMLMAIQSEQNALKALCADRQQVDQLKDRLMDVQQGTMQQVANILGLVQQQQIAVSDSKPTP